MAPLVSIVIPAYGHADFVLDAVGSALAQRYAPLEVIVVDDGSPDDTPARLAPLVAAGRIRYVRQPNAGVAAARNHGASLARGEYLLFFDDDDLLHPDALASLVAVAAGDPALAMVYGDRTDFRGASAVAWSAGATPPVVERADRLAFLVHNRIASPGQVLLRRRVFEALGGFDRSIWGADDWDLWLRLLAGERGAHVRQPVLAYRVHSANTSSATARMWLEARRVIERHLALVPAEDRAIVARHAVGWLRSYLGSQGARQLREAARRADWISVAAAGMILVRMWEADVRARMTLKVQLARRGLWRLPREHHLHDLK